jgi:FtsH-binding integral membrane protein
MDYSENPYASTMGPFAAMAETDERANFITKTYLHLAGAIALFVALEAILLTTPLAETMLGAMMGSRYGWLIVIGLFMFVSFIANKWAQSATSLTMQYAGLGLYVVAEAVIFIPLLYIATTIPKFEGVLPLAAVTTIGLFTVLTGVVFFTRKDFSFLRSFLIFGGFAMLGFFIAAIVFNFSLGPIIVYAGIALACGYILYDTSNVLHHYRIGQHVAASLALFASVALLFWYIIQLFMRSRD